ncbi:hypothetical protein STEG23_030211 [Scotinomys teguina]
MEVAPCDFSEEEEEQSIGKVRWKPQTRKPVGMSTGSGTGAVTRKILKRELMNQLHKSPKAPPHTPKQLPLGAHRSLAKPEIRILTSPV